ncbi:hypothetical protein BJ508DRAFT_305556 [Ascobolus immersus RN42]|uniref:Uncharacterized protein n=1 Tax=Ascobolus immersus RN42 TaxID=1160509 RepID=A0A3N4IE52_ASCIM|nr:hypothetical protein BJ508DRAFT_305556 [Ascobolus immersus RN42]
MSVKVASGSTATLRGTRSVSGKLQSAFGRMFLRFYRYLHGAVLAESSNSLHTWLFKSRSIEVEPRPRASSNSTDPTTMGSMMEEKANRLTEDTGSFRNCKCKRVCLFKMWGNRHQSNSYESLFYYAPLLWICGISCERFGPKSKSNYDPDWNILRLIGVCSSCSSHERSNAEPRPIVSTRLLLEYLDV